jgi:hypothetical protein
MDTWSLHNDVVDLDVNLHWTLKLLTDLLVGSNKKLMS